MISVRQRGQVFAAVLDQAQQSSSGWTPQQIDDLIAALTLNTAIGGIGLALGIGTLVFEAIKIAKAIDQARRFGKRVESAAVGLLERHMQGVSPSAGDRGRRPA